MRTFHLKYAVPSLLALALSLAAPVAPAWGANSVYVADESVAQYSYDAAGLLTLLSPATVLTTGHFPEDIALSPDGKSIYVTDFSSSEVFQYDVNAITGALTAKTPATVPAGKEPFHLAVSPDGRSAYVTDFAGDAVSQYDVDLRTGALSAKRPATVKATVSGTGGIAVSPDGRSVYVTNGNADSVSQYDANPRTGALSAKRPARVKIGRGRKSVTGHHPFPDSIAVSPDGRSLYVTDSGTDNVSQYDIGTTTGALTLKRPATVPTTGHFPKGIAVSPNGKSVYVADFGSKATQYDVSTTTGALTPKRPATVAAERDPRGIAVSPDGRSVYVANAVSGTLSQYNVDPMTGALTAKTPATVPALGKPRAVQVAGPTVNVGRVSANKRRVNTPITCNVAFCSGKVQVKTSRRYRAKRHGRTLRIFLCKRAFSLSADSVRTVKCKTTKRSYLRLKRALNLAHSRRAWLGVKVTLTQAGVTRTLDKRAAILERGLA